MNTHRDSKKGRSADSAAPIFIRDIDCTPTTPVVRGALRKPVYGQGVRIRPNIPGKQASAHDQKTYLPELLPLEAYDRIIVLFSGGKDSLAAYEVLRELGVPKSKISLWHHDIDGGNPDRRMDWPCTSAYVKAFADAEGVALRRSWRQNGFFGELYRLGASWPVAYEAGDGSVRICPLSDQQKRSQELRGRVLSELEHTELEGYGHREKFPAKSGDLLTRWCSAYLKIMVSDSVLRDLDALGAIGKRGKFPAKGSIQSGRYCSADLKRSVGDHVLRDLTSPCSGALMGEVQSELSAQLAHSEENIRILIVSGERRGESAGRSKYNEMELHRTHAVKRTHRLVHTWRPVIDYHEGDVWAVLRRHNICPHPCYRAGWNRCSCMKCIFSRPEHWAGIRQLFPKDFAALCEDERRLGFTLDSKMDLEHFVGDAKSCVYPDPVAIHQLVTGTFTTADVYRLPGTWQYPAGAFHGSEGGPC